MSQSGFSQPTTIDERKKERSTICASPSENVGVQRDYECARELQKGGGERELLEPWEWENVEIPACSKIAGAGGGVH